MSRIEDLETFVAIIDAGSLTGAARKLGRSLQAVSRSLGALENDVGIELIHRTTRQCRPNEAGQAFYQRVKPALTDIVEARSEISDRRLEPRGVLKIGAPTLFGPDFLVPIVAEFMRSYPQIEIDLQLTDTFVDLAAEGFDLVVRIAQLPDSGLQGKRLGALRRVVFGAPSYLKERGIPKHPGELRDHCCVVRTVDRRPGQWTFRAGGRPRKFSVSGSFRCNSMEGIYSAVRCGLGLGYSPLWQIKHMIDNGDVQIVLEDYEPEPVPIHVLWQENKYPPAKVRTFVDLLAKRLSLEGL